MECSMLVSSYIQWLGSEFTVNCLPDSCHIVTPFLRPDNDAIELYIYPSKSAEYTYMITDEGSSFEYLFLNGVDIENSSKRKAIIDSVTKRTTTYFDGTDLYTYARDASELNSSINNMINVSEN